MTNASTILFLVVDDLGTADLGFTGSQIRTPTLDALAAGGTVLSSYYVQRACTPTRAALLTGRYPLRYGFQSGVLEPRKAYGLALNETLVPQLLRSAGWATHAIGKWHLGFYRWEHTPTFRGFDSYYGYYTGGEDYFSHVAFGGGYDLRLDGSPRCGAGCSRVLWEANGTYSTHLFARRAVDVIRATPTAQKLYLYLATQAVHCPAQAPPEYIAPYKFANPQRNVFAGMLAALDEGIANVSAALRRAGRWEHSLVVVTADNGAPTTGCGGAQGGQNWPYRGGKCSAWEGGLRALSFAHGPALGVRAGATYDAPAHAVDWLPTLLAFAGVDGGGGGGGGFALDGISLRDALTGGGGGDDEREIVLEADPHAYPLDGGGWGGDQHATPYYALRRGRWKLLLGDPGQPGILDGYYCTGPPCDAAHNNTANASAHATPLGASAVQLFDVVADPHEADDRAAARPDLVAAMTARIVAVNASAASSAQQGAADDPRGDPAKHNGTEAPWL